MPKYRKKPVVIEAIQWHEKTMMMHDVLKHFGGLNGMGASSISRPAGKLLIETLEGTMTVSDGDWIIRGVKGELYPCKPEIFAATYELADPTPPVQPTTGTEILLRQQAHDAAMRAKIDKADQFLNKVWGGNDR